MDWVKLVRGLAAFLCRAGTRRHGLALHDVVGAEVEVERALVPLILTHVLIQAFFSLLEHVDLVGTTRYKRRLELGETLERRALLNASLLVLLDGPHLAVRLGRITKPLHTTEQFAFGQLLVANIGHLHFSTLIGRDVTDLVELGLEVLSLDLVQAELI